MKNTKKILLNIILIAVSVTIALFISEVIVRLFAPQQLILIRSDIWCPEASVGWRLCPNVSTTVNSGGGSIQLNTDEMGHRINGKDKIDSPDIRVLVLGDSMVEAIQVEDHETIPAVMEKLLSKRNNKKISVVNAGVGGWDPNQYLIQAKEELGRTMYDMGVVFLYPANDIVTEIKTFYLPRKNIVRHTLRIPAAFTWEEIIESVLYPINDFLEVRSHLFIFLRRTFKRTLMKFGLTAYSISPVFIKNNVGSDMWEITATICKNINTQFQKHNIPLVFVLIPASYQIDGDEFSKFLSSFSILPETVDLDQPNRILKEEFEQLGLEVLDPLNEMRVRAFKGDILYGKVDKHCSRSGYKMLAELVVPVVEDRLNYRFE